MGLSSAPLNVVWAAINALQAWLLLCRVGHFDLDLDLGNGEHALAFSLWISRRFSRLHAGTGAQVTE